MEISVALIITVLVRLLVPLCMFKWRIGGVLLAAAVDALDVVLMDSIGVLLGETKGFGTHYQFFDKWLDMYYLTFAVIISFSWKNTLARNTSIILFVYRLAGLILFEITGIRKLFFFFPNLFENFYIFYSIANRFFPKYVPKTLLQLVFVLFLLYLPKLLQEWALHYAQLQPWEWIKLTFSLGL
jgi:hypothetical protein